MPEDLGPLSDVPIGMLVFGGFIVAIFVSVFATVIVKGAGQWRRNNASPVVTDMARVVTKRAEVSGGTGESVPTPHISRRVRCRPANGVSWHCQHVSSGSSPTATPVSSPTRATRFKGFVRPRIASR
jgi:hypothetical protein